MKNKGTIVFVVIFVAIVFGVAAWAMIIDNQEQTASDSGAEISIEPASFNFNKVSQKEGVVSTNFTVTNPGTSDLIIDDMLSSCSCTSATLTVNGQTSPSFGMHNNPSNWSVTIEPGRSAELKVSYDPDVHKDFRGLATREITIFSNADNNAEKKARITINQVD